MVRGSGLENGAKVAGAEAIVVRQLAALAEEGSLGAPDDIRRQVARYRSVLERVFIERSVVPLPYGTTFRSLASVERWLELHYSPLLEALEFVAERVMMRVRVRAAAPAPTDVAAASLDGRLWSVLRGLKGDAVAAIPLGPGAQSGAVHGDAVCAYLIERDAIPEFERRVATLTSAEPVLKLDLSGPFPAYDFVQMEFGG